MPSASVDVGDLGCILGHSMQFQVRSHEEAAIDIRERTEFFSFMVTYGLLTWVSNFQSLKLKGGKG